MIQHHHIDVHIAPDARHPAGGGVLPHFNAIRVVHPVGIISQPEGIRIQLIEEQLKVENLSNEERIRLSRQLAEAQNNLDKLMTDNRIKAANDATEAAKKAAEEAAKKAAEEAAKNAAQTQTPATTPAAPTQ